MQIVEGNNDENKTNIRCAYMLFGINLIKIKQQRTKLDTNWQNLNNKNENKLL